MLDPSEHPMRLFGYEEGVDAEEPTRLREVSLVVGPERLRQIAAFCEHAARLMDEHQERFGHLHLCDFVRDTEMDADIIVVRG